jgi:hypothetical protein
MITAFVPVILATVVPRLAREKAPDDVGSLSGLGA